MAVIEDVKALPKDAPKLKNYTIYCLLICLSVSVFMTIWYIIRMNSNDDQISSFWSIIHVCAYITASVVTGLGLFGAYYPKPQFLSWFLIVILSLIVAEVMCILYNQSIVDNKLGIIPIVIKVLAIIVFITSCVLAFLWKQLIDKMSNKKSETVPKSDKAVKSQKNGTKAEDKPKIETKA